MAEKQDDRGGGEQPPQAPTGMYLDPGSGLTLPRGVRLATRAEVARAWFLGLALFIGTLGIGYVAWSVVEWGNGWSPAQRMLGLRCWRPDARQVAGRGRTAARQVTGFCLNGEALAGFFVWLADVNQRSMGDVLAGTVILSDPAGVLGSSPPTGG